LVVDPNAVLALAITSEHLEPITRRDSQVLQSNGTMEIEQLASRHTFDVSESPYTLIVEQRLRIPASK